MTLSKQTLWGLLLLLGISFLIYLQAEPVRYKMQVAKASQHLLKTDDAMYQTEIMLGGDFVLIEHLRKHYPLGTQLFLRFHMDDKRGQRLRLVLLPEYVIDQHARLGMCKKDALEEGDRVILKSDTLALIERGGVSL